MNELILKLFRQACYYGDYEPENVSDEVIEKFAELIVRECAQLVQGVPVDTMGYNTADRKIREHFEINK